MRVSLDELKSMLWGAAVLLRGKINATGYKEYIFPLVFFKRISDVHLEERRKALEMSGGDEEFADAKENYKFDIPKGCLWDDIREVTENVGQALVTAWTRIEQANPDRVVGDRVVEGLGGIFGKRDHWTNKNILTDETLSELIEHFSKIDLSIASCPADEMGNAYEYLVGKFADDAGNTAQEFYTNRTVVELMAEILEPKPGESIYDPTAGTGGMLISCIARCKGKNGNWREIKAYGQEQNALTSSVARMNLFLHGVEEFRIINDDTLLRPGFLNAGKLKTFDVVLANPPYSIKQWNRELFAHDPYDRNFLGTPPQGRADYAFIQHILKSMNPKTGRCAILLPHGVLFREEEKEIRKALLDADLLECVIGLAPNLFYNSPMEACIMICRANKPKATKGKVLFINAVNEVTRKNAESKLEPAHIEKIIAAYAKRESDGVFSQVATREEIAAKQDSLAISLYAHVGTGGGDGVDLKDALIDFVLSSEETSKAITNLDDAVNDRPVKEVSSRPPMPKVKVPRLEKGMRRIKLGEMADEVRDKWSGSTAGVPVVGLEHLEPDEIWLRQWEKDVEENTFTKAFRKGQLLLGRRRVYQKKLSLAPCDGICSGDITVIAARPKAILPELLPFYLRTDSFFDYAMQGSAGSLSPRVKWAHLADYEFDLPSIDRQHELAELLWAANDLKEKYKKLISASDEMLKAKFREMFGECGGEIGGVGVELEAVCETFIDGDWIEAKDQSDSGIRLVQTGNVGEGEYLDRQDKARWISEATFARLHCTEILAGDILISRLPDPIGRACIFPEGIGKAITAVDCTIVRLRETMLPEFLIAISRSTGYMMQIAKLTAGTTRARVSRGNLGKIKVPLPPLDRQRQFVEIAAQEEKVKANLKKSIADVDNIIKGLING